MAGNEANPYWQPHSFTWDENKRRINIYKHGIDFVDAVEVFRDSANYTYRSKHPPGEIRYVTVGRLRQFVIAVISTPRVDSLRIISARLARRSERKRYG
ncbi:MAG: BrnT family toxin [Rhodopseudomonas sp.]|uniref:BrnT family toxin n=1 Tax=Rhodopseudomonas sp. TaxID=1078 RepID=UPI0017C0D4DF|nr:BrnT family toxin [Rhodopseudomonas sp.]NVN84987.1 BrnT family toxin [Rhodopseudomonas sp.]